MTPNKKRALQTFFDMMPVQNPNANNVFMSILNPLFCNVMDEDVSIDTPLG